MEFKEIKVAKLDKDDIQLWKQLNAERERIDRDALALIPKVNLFWDNLRKKYFLRFSEKHFIKNNCIYKRELS